MATVLAYFTHSRHSKAVLGSLTPFVIDNPQPGIMFAACILVIGTLGVLARALPLEGVRGTFQRRCGNPQGPDAMFILDEARPDASLPVNGTIFRVAQKARTGGGASGGLEEATSNRIPHTRLTQDAAGHAAARQYLLVHFPTTPYGSVGCELSLNVPEGISFQLQAKQSSAYSPPFRSPTWNNFVPDLSAINALPLGAGVVAKTACSNGPPPGGVGGGYGLAFVLQLADTVEAAGSSAAVSFDFSGHGSGGPQGPILRSGC